MVSMPGPRGLEKLNVNIISQNENESGMIRVSAHPEAEKPEEQQIAIIRSYENRHKALKRMVIEKYAMIEPSNTQVNELLVSAIERRF